MDVSCFIYLFFIMKRNALCDCRVQKAALTWKVKSWRVVLVCHFYSLNLTMLVWKIRLMVLGTT